MSEDRGFFHEGPHRRIHLTFIQLRPWLRRLRRCSGENIRSTLSVWVGSLCLPLVTSIESDPGPSETRSLVETQNRR